MFSIVMPLDTNRLKQFKVTKRVYDKMEQTKEFLIPTRSAKQVQKFLDDNNLNLNVKLLPYTHEIGFNPSKAFNLAVREAHYDNIIITSPEVKPVTDVLHQLEGFVGQNIVCQVDDEDVNGKKSNLVSSIFRHETPGMYFLAMFNKKDIYAINGWDEEFMKGYAYEDNDFGERFNRAGLKFKVVDEIKALHQYHPRTETIPNGTNINERTYTRNNAEGVTKCKNGLVVI